MQVCHSKHLTTFPKVSGVLKWVTSLQQTTLIPTIFMTLSMCLTHFVFINCHGQQRV
jgi:hypothetical protein